MRKRIIFILNKYKLSVLVYLFHVFPGKSRFIGLSRTRNNRVVYGVANIYKSRVNLGLGEHNSVHIGDNTDLHNSRILIKGDNNKIEIGDNSFINGLSITIEGDNNRLVIGNEVFILDDTRFYVVDGSVLTVGDNCMFSDRIDIRTTDNHAILDLNSGKRVNREENVIIGDHVWIGHSVTVLKGSEIAEGCIVGSASVITKKHRVPNTVIVGNPGRERKKNVYWTMER